MRRRKGMKKREGSKRFGDGQKLQAKRQQLLFLSCKYVVNVNPSLSVRKSNKNKAEDHTSC